MPKYSLFLGRFAPISPTSECDFLTKSEAEKKKARKERRNKRAAAALVVLNEPCETCWMYYECPKLEKRKVGQPCEDWGPNS